MKLLHEGIGHTVTCELKTGEMYRGHLMNCEDNMNAMLEGVTVTGRDGKVTNLEQVYLRPEEDLSHDVHLPIIQIYCICKYVYLYIFIDNIIVYT